MEYNEIMMQEGAPEETDSFMAGWEETSPAGGELEETGETDGDQNARGEESAGSEAKMAGGDQTGENGQRGDAVPIVEGRNGDVGNAEGGDQDHGGQQEQPRTWTLNHLGNPVTASEADMVTLAQKGLDYDRIRQDYDEAKPVMSLFRDFAKRAGVSVPEYLASIRAQAKEAEGMSAEEARRAVDLENREAIVAAKEEARQQQAEAARREDAIRRDYDTRMQRDLQEFRDVFPEAANDPASIPKEVWAEVRSGRSLVSAYARHQQNQAAAAAERAAAEEKNRQNAARSVGSMRSAGEDGGGKDPFLEGWNE